MRGTSQTSECLSASTSGPTARGSPMRASARSAISRTSASSVRVAATVVEQRRHRLRVADPAEQLRREGPLAPLGGRPEPGHVLVHQAEAVVGVEQPGGALGGAARLLLEHRLERLEVRAGW